MEQDPLSLAEQLIDQVYAENDHLQALDSIRQQENDTDAILAAALKQAEQIKNPPKPTNPTDAYTTGIGGLLKAQAEQNLQDRYYPPPTYDPNNPEPDEKPFGFLQGGTPKPEYDPNTYAGTPEQGQLYPNAPQGPTIKDKVAALNARRQAAEYTRAMVKAFIDRYNRPPGPKDKEAIRRYVKQQLAGSM